MNRFLFALLFVSFLSNSQEKSNTIRVYFNSNSTDLASNELSVINDVFSDETLTFYTINVSGFCDDIGSFEANKILSDKRAQTVANFLKSEFDISATSALGKGEIAIEDLNSNLDDIRKNNRCVSIFYTFTEDKIKPSVEVETTNPALKFYKTFDDKLVVGDKIIIKNLLFRGNLTVFQKEEDALIELNKVVDYLNKNPNTTIEIQGHVCCIGSAHSDAFDKFSGKTNLSHTRAKKIYDYLVEKGIASSRMTHMGYGRKFPIANGIESDNKRVEILITKI
jgi:outer membrane protein OmpA-like peptidoglycan-associated protein